MIQRDGQASLLLPGRLPWLHPFRTHILLSRRHLAELLLSACWAQVCVLGTAVSHCTLGSLNTVFCSWQLVGWPWGVSSIGLCSAPSSSSYVWCCMRSCDTVTAGELGAPSGEISCPKAPLTLLRWQKGVFCLWTPSTHLGGAGGRSRAMDCILMFPVSASIWPLPRAPAPCLSPVLLVSGFSTVMSVTLAFLPQAQFLCVLSVCLTSGHKSMQHQRGWVLLSSGCRNHRHDTHTHTGRVPQGPNGSELFAVVSGVGILVAQSPRCSGGNPFLCSQSLLISSFAQHWIKQKSLR